MLFSLLANCLGFEKGSRENKAEVTKGGKMKNCFIS